MSYEELDPRKMLILKAIIDDYITSKEPVGSRTIAKKYQMGLSSATIRNEMADLEEMGYLSQPHTSAGRIPSEKGYRLYVDKLMNPGVNELKPTEDELSEICGYMENKIHEMNNIVKAASEIVSRITHYTAIGMASSEKKHTVKALQIIPVDLKKVLVIVVLDNDVIKNQMVKTPDALSAEELSKLSVICSNMLTGTRADSISLDDEQSLLQLADDVTIDSELTDEELRREVIKAVEDLGEPDSSIIFRKYYYGESSKEIAKATGLSVSNVDTRTHRALNKLRKMFGGNEV